MSTLIPKLEKLGRHEGVGNFYKSHDNLILLLSFINLVHTSLQIIPGFLFHDIVLLILFDYPVIDFIVVFGCSSNFLMTMKLSQ
jgi:hypothetical protein